MARIKAFGPAIMYKIEPMDKEYGELAFTEIAIALGRRSMTSPFCPHMGPAWLTLTMSSWPLMALTSSLSPCWFPGML